MTPIELTAILVRDVLGQPEGDVVVLGRHNIRRDDFSALQIAIDALADGRNVSATSDYDGGAEVLTQSNKFSQTMLVDFYGDEAYTEAQRFAALVNSQAGYEIQRDRNFSIKRVGVIRDLRFIPGEQYSNRFQLELFAEFNNTVSIETKRIDTLQITIIEG